MCVCVSLCFILIHNNFRFQDIFAAATDTTGTTLAWAMSELMHSPETMEKTQQEVREVLGENKALITNSDIPKLQSVQMVIKETLRLHPPAPLVPRAAREDCIIMGYDIPKGINVLIYSQSPMILHIGTILESLDQRGLRTTT